METARTTTAPPPIARRGFDSSCTIAALHSELHPRAKALDFTLDSTSMALTNLKRKSHKRHEIKSRPSGPLPESPSEAQTGIPSSSAKAAVAGALKALIVPIALALSTFLWWGNSTSLIYSEDGILFVNPFGYASNPTAAYSYLYSWDFPVPDHQVYFYIDSLTNAVSTLGLAPAEVDRFFLSLCVFVAALGVVILFKRASQMSGGRARHSYEATCIAATLYIFNPFSLSIIWWHFGGWTFFYTLLPWVALLGIEAVYANRLTPTPLLATTLLGFVFAPGANGGYAASVTLFAIIAIFFILIRSLAGVISRLEAIKRILYVSSGIALTLSWSFVPFLLALHGSGYNPTSGAGLATSFSTASTYTTAWNTMRLVAFSWLYGVPNAYAWISLLPYLAVMSFVLPLMYLVGGLYLSRAPPLMILYVAGALGLAFSLQGNTPFGLVNEQLFAIGGPFLIWVSAYYFLGEFWVLAICAGVYLVASDLSVNWRKTRTSTSSKTARLSNYSQSLNLKNRVTRLRSSGNDFVQVTSISLTLVLLVVTLLPVATNKVYQPSGPNVSEISVPQSFSLLNKYFSQNYSGPSYFTLVLPLSTTSAMFLQLGNDASFTDDGVLLSRYIPYPLIWNTASKLEVSLDDYLANGSWGYLSSVLSVLHIKYVVFNPYANMSVPYMAEAPSGERVNISAIDKYLSNEGEVTIHVGTFGVVNITNATRIVQADPTLSAFDTSYGEFINFVASLSQTTILQYPWIREAQPSPSFVPNALNSQIQAIGEASYAMRVPPGYNPAVIDNSGNISQLNRTIDRTPELAGVVYNPLTRLLTITPTLLFSLSEAKNFSTNFALWDGTLSGLLNSSSYIQLDNTVPKYCSINATFKLQNFSLQNWISFRLYSINGVSASAFLYLEPSTGIFNLGTVASYQGTAYAWNNLPLPSLGAGSQLTLSMTATQTGLSVGLTDLNTGWTKSTLLTLLPWQLSNNQGLNSSAIPPYGLSSSVVANITTVGPAITFTSVTATSEPDVRFALISQDIGNISSIANQQVTFSSTDQIELTLQSAPRHLFVVLALPDSPLWQANCGIASIQKLSIWAFLNVFEIVLSHSNETVSVSLSFETGLDSGLYFSFVILAIDITLLLVACTSRLYGQER